MSFLNGTTTPVRLRNEMFRSFRATILKHDPDQLVQDEAGLRDKVMTALEITNDEWDTYMTVPEGTRQLAQLFAKFYAGYVRHQGEDLADYLSVYG